MTNKFKDAYTEFLDTWGEDAQIMMATEEMSELTKELCKYLRYKNWQEDKVSRVIPNINEEIADVLNCVEQLELVFDSNEVNAIRQEKIERTLKRLRGE